MRTRRAQEGLGYWPGDTELSDGFAKLWGLCMFVGKRKRPRRAVDLEGTWARWIGGGGEQSLRH